MVLVCINTSPDGSVYTDTNFLNRNRYPGARFDSESYSYSFSFSQEALDEWNWTEHFAPQTEMLKYCQYLVQKFDLKRDIQFDTRIKAAHYQDDTRSWLLTDENGQTYRSRFLVTCLGILDEPTYPDIPGVQDFKGKSFHTARWPDHVSLEGKRVGIIGTGATGIQNNPGDCQDGRPFNRLPTHTKLVGPAAQLEDQSGGNGRDPVSISGNLSTLQ